MGVDGSAKAPERDEKPRPTKEERLQREREILVSQLAADRLDTVRSRVAFVLNHHPEARNSDPILFLTYWRKFQPDVLGPDESLDEEKVLHLENPTSLTRARQKIQNEFGLFQATEEIRTYRRERRVEIREEQILDKPGRPLIEVFSDESGKNSLYALVGSLWALDAYGAAQLVFRLLQFKHSRGIRHEFHFAELTRHKVDVTKDFFREAMARSDTFSFKAVAVRQVGLDRKGDEIYRELYYRLIIAGLGHEIDHGRAVPPRILHVFKDKDETHDVLDALAVARLKEELTAGLGQKYRESVTLELLETVNSRDNLLIQLTDLFTGSINRVLNGGAEARNHKDEVAEFVLGTLGLEVSPNGTVAVQNQDVATLIVV